jgi:uncharacterized protein (TIGR02118 family)
VYGAVVVRFVALYPQPTDAAAFEQHYFGVHVPIAKKLPGLRNYTVSRNLALVRGQDPIYMIAELDWDDMASLRRDFASPLGQEAKQDLDKLAELCRGISSMTFHLEAP